MESRNGQVLFEIDKWREEKWEVKKHSISEYLKKNYGELWNHQLIRTFRKNIGSANEIILGKDFPAEVGMNYMKFDVFSEENMEQMNKCYAELIKSYGGQNVLWNFKW